MKRSIVIYGISLALLALLLNAMRYYYFVSAFTAEIYITLIAILFLGIGIWAGRKLTSGKNTVKPEFKPNRKAIEYLGISERELDILKLIAEGLSNSEIAGKLYISINTVKTHVSNLLSKLDADRRTHAVKKARSLKIIR